MRIIPILLGSLLFSSSLFAFEPFVIKDIRFQGLERISEGTVLNYLPVKVGDSVNDSKTPPIMKALFKTGFFSDIQLSRDGSVLVVTLKERPAIGKINITGNRDIKTEELEKALKSAGFSEGRTFDKALLAEVEQELQRQYFSRGKYGVTIDTTVTPESRNRVLIDMRVHEGRVAKIREIHFVGNHLFQDSTLEKQMQLSTTNWLSWFTKEDQYAKQKLAGDRETIRSYYLDRGYLNFDLRSTQVAISQNKQDIYITFNLKEGEQYRVSELGFRGRLIVPESELRTLLKSQKGDVFSRREITESVTAMSDRLGEEGYAFAKIDVEPVLDKENKTVALIFRIDPGQRYYVRQVRFVGNIKTRDDVLRREVAQFEGAFASSKRIKEAEAHLNRTGYFSEVQVDVQPVPGTSDQVDVVYTVKETASGQVSGSIGYSDLDGILFQFSVSNRNFVGTGNNVDFVFNKSAAATTYSVGYSNPYYTSWGVSRGFNLYYNETNLSHTTTIANYSTDNLGGDVSVGIPLNDLTKFTLSTGYNRTALAVNPYTVTPEIQGFIDQYGLLYQEVNASAGLTYNSLDRFTFPEKGSRASMALAGSVPGSELQYYKTTLEMQWYHPLWKSFIVAARGMTGYGVGYGKTHDLPFYKNFFAGGSRSVRGYGESALGPRDLQGAPLGGNLKVEGSLGLVLPNFIAPESKAIRLQAFVDGGQVYDTRDIKRVTDGQFVSVTNQRGLRYSTGLSVTWISPLAPLVFSYALPLNASAGDDVQRFAFSFGTYF